MNAKTIKELRRIQKSIPQELLDNLMVMTPVTPNIKKVFQKALKDPDVNEVTKKRFKNMLDAGALDKKELQPDEKVEEEIDKYLNKQIKLAIKEGRIPDPKKDDDIIKFKKKLKKWTNKQSSKNIKKK